MSDSKILLSKFVWIILSNIVSKLQIKVHAWHYLISLRQNFLDVRKNENFMSQSFYVVW